MRVIATLTEENRVHELVLDEFKGRSLYSLQTSVDGVHVAMRTLTQQEAGEWIELAEQRRAGVGA